MIGLADLAYHIRQEFKVVGARAMHNARTQQAHWARVLDAYVAVHTVPSSEILCPYCDYQCSHGSTESSTPCAGGKAAATDLRARREARARANALGSLAFQGSAASFVSGMGRCVRSAHVETEGWEEGRGGGVCVRVYAGEGRLCRGRGEAQARHRARAAQRLRVVRLPT